MVGDEAELKMVIQNNSKQDVDLTALFEGVGVELIDAESETKLSISSKDKATLTYRIKATNAQEAVLRFGAKGDEFEDAVEITIPIHRHSTPETVGTSGVLIEDGVNIIQNGF